MFINERKGLILIDQQLRKKKCSWKRQGGGNIRKPEKTSNIFSVTVVILLSGKPPDIRNVAVSQFPVELVPSTDWFTPEYFLDLKIKGFFSIFLFSLSAV